MNAPVEHDYEYEPVPIPTRAKTGDERIQVEAHAEGIVKLRHPGTRRYAWGVVCQECGVQDMVHVGPSTPTQVIVKKFCERGMFPNPARALCMACSKKMIAKVTENFTEEDLDELDRAAKNGTVVETLKRLTAKRPHNPEPKGQGPVEYLREQRANASVTQKEPPPPPPPAPTPTHQEAPMATKTRPKGSNRLTQVQAFEVGQVVQKYCTKVDGYAVYQDGWDDERVAQLCTAELGYIVNANNVGFMRTGVVGPVRSATVRVPRSEFDTLLAMISELEARVATLEARG
jgi:hypothetical protein